MASTAASTTSIEHSPVTPTKPAVVQLPSSPLGGEASSSTLPAPEAVTSITDEKPTIELSSSIPSEPELTPHAPSSTGDMSLSQSQHADAHDHTQPESLPIDEVPTPVPAPARAKSLSITLLLISGVRYPFTINSEYLSRHNIQVADSDPMQMGVFALKECIWKEWKDEEWNVKPPSANFIRLIHFGRLLDDRQQLKDCRLNPDTPNVVHMTVRPAELGDDDGTQRSTKMAFGRDREHREGSSPSCRCVIL